MYVHARFALSRTPRILPGVAAPQQAHMTSVMRACVAGQGFSSTLKRNLGVELCPMCDFGGLRAPPL